MIAGRGVSHLEKTVEEINYLGVKSACRACDVPRSGGCYEKGVEIR